MKNFRDRLGRELLLMDGAMGTMLQSRGLKLGELPGNMNLRAPEVVRGIHAEYAAAGADVIQANTFGVSRLKFGDEAANVVRAGIRIAREAVDASGCEAYVAADIGPLGRLLKPVGELEFEDAVDLFREVIEASREADLLLFETFTDVYELKAALLAARICPAARDFMLPSHASREPMARALLEALDLQPPIHADMALGEGTGAVMVFPLLDMALRVYAGEHTFGNLGMEAYEPQEGKP